ncbi:unnamed protein product [Linum tenue]|uniref:Uncharacterized protein n=1 Tax=Linum tenue TaxID=586396 RepID=A0AAV0RUJ8_9ROSI|nr:unnamed protein product [Linum tenue]
MNTRRTRRRRRKDRLSRHTLSWLGGWPEKWRSRCARGTGGR